MIVAVREHPQPLVAFVGELDAAGIARLSELAGLLDEADLRLRLFGWSDVEVACRRLARQLTERLSPDELDRCVVAAMPRGGLIVAGLLAYALGIPRHRIVAPAESAQVHDGQLLLLVDDCILSGARLRETLAAMSVPRVVVASLWSHPDLRVAVEAAEPRVTACVAGDDLRDHTSALLGDDEAAWRRRWSARVPQRYHTALLDLVAFPWSEPDVRLWNPVTEQLERHWWLAPTSSCMHHSAVAPALEVRTADEWRGAERLAPFVVPVPRTDATLLLDTRAGGRVLRFRGSSDELLRAWAAAGDVDAAAEAVAVRCGVSPARVRGDLCSLLAELSDRGLLAPVT